MDLSPDEDNFPGRILHQAALWDNLELLQELIAGGTPVDARDHSARTALHAAALAERSRCLVALCAAGADVDARQDLASGSKTALHIAAARGHEENARALVAAGADAALADAAGDTALALAERAGHARLARYLCQAKEAAERARLAEHAALRELVVRGGGGGGGGGQQLRARLAALGAGAERVVNLAPGGASTLLYVAAEAGDAGAVRALLAAGADGRAHPVTRYGPLYIAAYHGHRDIARELLRHFPTAVQQETVERWLPLHAACIGGHAALVSLLLQYPYPDSMLSVYTEPGGECQYRAAFDANARDVSGQSALYVACTLGNVAVVDALLDHTAPALAAPAPGAPAPARPVRAGVSHGIHALVSKLTGGGGGGGREGEPRRARPVGVRGGGALGAAVRGGHVRVVRRLLAAGADVDEPLLTPTLDVHKESAEEARTPLAEAARARNWPLVELLLAHGATDSGGAALRECARQSRALVPVILATKAYPDPEHKVNKAAVGARVFSPRAARSHLTYRALCPSTPVIVNWRDLRCGLATISMEWVRAAALRVNPGVGSGAAALHAVTRVDLSHNDLTQLPPELFTMLSLKCLNVAQNKLDRLPAAGDPLEDADGAATYSAPLLEEIYLQDNRLEELPAALFSLPALAALDVSNNKLRSLPAGVWGARSLRDLNVAFNHLRDLPHPQSSAEGAVGSTPARLCSPPPTHEERHGKVGAGGAGVEAGDRAGGRGPPAVGDRTGHAVWSSARRVHRCPGAEEACVPPPPLPPPPPPPPPPHASSPTSPTAPPAPPRPRALATLNLSHNQFTCVPAVLACAAPALTTLNMAYNSLRSMSYVTSYPTALRQLDLSHNEITCWPSLPQVESFGSGDQDPLACYCPGAGGGGGGGRPRPRSGGSARSQLLGAVCQARRHLRLEGLRTLILANNLLTRIQLTTDGAGADEEPETDEGPVADECEGAAGADEAEADAEAAGEGEEEAAVRARLLFPLLSMLDVSCNLLRRVPAAIHRLAHLSVLNISGNGDVSELPPQMGLLSRLWNLSAAGCPLQEPLRSMLAAGNYRTADVVAYLHAVLHRARPYATIKLMVVGVQGIGKTSLLECLRQESAIGHRRKQQTEHWAKRMGNRTPRRGCKLSTVGVDIGTWVYERQRGARGPVTFRTWDFGGQQEYYATHQYFLSRRSLYLVLWKVTDGRRGLAGALHWLRSIQARAPGSPVIMVATHYDQVDKCSWPEGESPERLQRIIRTRIMAAPDLDKLGLPRVYDTIEVSCSTRHNIRLLADAVYGAAWSVRPAGSKRPLLEQRVPAAYLALERCVAQLAAELPEPVVRHARYRQLVGAWLRRRGVRALRAPAALRRATAFLHDHGVLLHYRDAALRDLYFLRPQWLCDVLAHVVTVREVNPFAVNGVMRAEELSLVLRASPALSAEAGALALALLHKFELALTWDARLLLVPPLLPATEPERPQLPLRSRAWGGARRAWVPAVGAVAGPGAGGDVGSPHHRSETDSPRLITEDGVESGCVCVEVEARDCGRALRRLVLLSYVPCGFWARLCTRVLADDALADVAPAVYTLPTDMDVDEATARALELRWSWKLWKTGLRLACGALTLAELREVAPRRDLVLGGGEGEGEWGEEWREGEGEEEVPARWRLRQEGAWCEVDARASACVCLTLPARVCVLRRQDRAPLAGYQSISIEPNPEPLAKLLALLTEHVDLLLEDWYPALGTRFVHTSEGRCLVTRVVPCPLCMRHARDPPLPRPLPRAVPPARVEQALRRLRVGGDGGQRQAEVEGEGEGGTSDVDSGVDAESAGSSRLGSVEGAAAAGGGGGEGAEEEAVVYAWTVEECVLASCTGEGAVTCARHGAVALREAAPDAALQDVGGARSAGWGEVEARGVAGQGAFGTVLRARWRGQDVAVKLLQPHPPPRGAHTQHLQQYKAAAARWERDPWSGASRAYCALRQELSVLSALRHAHVAPLLAVCGAPLALVLALAPRGALVEALRRYAAGGARVGCRAARALALQVARALEYLHAKRVLYRDLKAENVLVWSMPEPREAAAAERSSAPIPVHVKLGDYGISRMAPWSGTKGFGGTEGFMAPEIMRYNGEEEYNEKVDCFSYGMLLYEILTLRQPYEGHEAVKEAILDGATPALTPRDLQYPCGMVEAMRACWAVAPELRPSAAALVSLAAAPEYTALQDACAVGVPARGPAARAPLAGVDGGGGGGGGDEDAADGWEVWCGGGGGERGVHALAATRHAFQHVHTLSGGGGGEARVTAACLVGDTMWLGDSAGTLTVYSTAQLCALWAVRVHECVGGPPAAVAALQSLEALDRVAVATDVGRLFLVSCSPPVAEGGFVLSELGAATSLRCLAAVEAGGGWQVWAGGDRLYVYAVGAAGVSDADALGGGGVELLAAAAEGGRAVLAVHTEPGCVVQRWCARTRQTTARLDCSKLAPVSESLQSMSVEETRRDGAGAACGAVTALCCVAGLACAGTRGGCLVLADADTLRPITVCRPHLADVFAILPLEGGSARGEGREAGDGGEGGGGDMLVTLGRGYRPLLQRYTPQQPCPGAGDADATYALLWRARRWLPD